MRLVRSRLDRESQRLANFSEYLIYILHKGDLTLYFCMFASTVCDIICAFNFSRDVSIRNIKLLNNYYPFRDLSFVYFNL